MTDVMQDAVRVKPLEWDSSIEASSPVGFYRCQRLDDKWETLRDGYYMLPRVHGTVKALDTLDAAKAAAQADYETRIRSALLPPVPVNSYLPVPVAWQYKRLQNGVSSNVHWIDMAGSELAEFNELGTVRGTPVETVRPLYAAPVNSYEEMRAALTWLPIETAPRDRTAVLLGEEGWLHAIVGYFSPSMNTWLEHGSFDTKANVATKWMPLPALPAALDGAQS